MRTRQTISIIGDTGNMGSGLAKSLSKGNYRLLLCGLQPENAAALITEIKQEYPSADVAAQDCAVNAGWEADIIILAVPWQAEQAIAEKIKEVANQKMVLSLAAAPAGALQQLLPYSKVVQVCLHMPDAGGHKKPEMLLAGNDTEALQTASKLAQAAGFRSVIADS